VTDFCHTHFATITDDLTPVSEGDNTFQMHALSNRRFTTRMAAFGALAILVVLLSVDFLGLLGAGDLPRASA